MNEFKGILPALVTPFDDENRFNENVFARLLERVYAAGVHGIYINGSTGEGFLQSIAQRQKITEAAAELSPPDKQIIVHVGALSTQDAVTLTRHAGSLKVAAVSALPPPGNYSFGEIKSYYEAIAESSTVPVLAYHFPNASSLKLNADQLIELCRIPNIIGLKFTDYDFFALCTVKESGAVVYNGYDEVLVAGLLMGADGGIGTIYNLIPERFVRLYDLTVRNEWTEAQALQREINELIRIIVRYPVFPATKAILKMSGIDCGYCLLPRRSLTAAQEERLRDEIVNSLFADCLLAEKTSNVSI